MPGFQNEISADMPKAVQNIARVQNFSDIAILVNHGVSYVVSFGVGHGVRHMVSLKSVMVLVMRSVIGSVMRSVMGSARGQSWGGPGVGFYMSRRVLVPKVTRCIKIVKWQ